LLDVIQDSRGGRTQDEAASATIENFVRLDGWFDVLVTLFERSRISISYSEISQHCFLGCTRTHLGRFVQHRESISGYKDRALPTSPLAIDRRVFDFALRLSRKARQLVQSIVRGYGENPGTLSRIKTQSPGRDIRTAELSNAQETNI
jgi:hypothetical protein